MIVPEIHSYWIDASGHPHSDVLRVTERYTRTDENRLHYEPTIDDSKTYTKPWSTGFDIAWRKGWEPYEYICQENNKDLEKGHIVGK